jgi:hypothetical protein
MLIPWHQEEILERSKLRKTVLSSSPNEDSVLSVAQKLSTVVEQRQGQICLLRRGDYRNRGHNAKELSWAPAPVKMFSVFWKLMMVEEDDEERHCLFRQRDCRKKHQNIEKVFWVRVLGKDIFFYILETN